MAATFDQVAQRIIKDTLRSAVCIDDAFIEPYCEPSDQQSDIETPKGLRRSFQKANCTLEVAAFKGRSDFKRKREFLLDQRDLLVLDWELSPNDPVKFTESLFILDSAIDRPSLPFVLIYTAAPDLVDVEFQIRSYLAGLSNPIRQERMNLFMEKLDAILNLDEFLDLPIENSQELLAAIKPILKQCLIQGIESPKRELSEAIRTLAGNNNVGGKLTKSIEDLVVEIYSKQLLREECWSEIGFALFNNVAGKKTHRRRCQKVVGVDHALFCNHTFIFLMQKGVRPQTSGVRPEMVFERLAQMVHRRPASIVTLMALEHRNHTRRNAHKIGKSVLELDEKAFWYNFQNFKYDETQFFDFLLLIWKNQLSAFLLDSSFEISGILGAYFTEHAIEDQLKKWDKQDKLKQLSSLNSKFSVIESAQLASKRLGFGDIFYHKKGSIVNYYLNITAHCDCLVPSKVRNHFMFIQGNVEPSLETALENIDSDTVFHSFIETNKGPIAIRWFMKPVTIFLPSAENSCVLKSTPLSARVGANDISLQFIGTLVENYSQQIANQVLANSTRVGIDMAKIIKPPK